jgi:hypothetical protein
MRKYKYATTQSHKSFIFINKEMEYNFPITWKKTTSSNANATHVFNVEDTKVLITIQKHKEIYIYRMLQNGKMELELQIEHEKHNMVEQDVHTLPFSDKNGSGWYFMATDKNWHNGAEDWPFMLRSVYVTTLLIVELTVLCYNKESNTIKEAFEWMKKL